MPKNLPQSDIPDVREYLYVDTVRVRGLLAQVADGVLDEQGRSRSRTDRLRIGSKILGRESDNAQTTSDVLRLDDLHVSMLEEAAEPLGLIADISEVVRKEKSWLRGKTRNALEPGMLIRVTAPTLLFDPGSLMDTLRGFGDALDDEADPTFEAFLDVAATLYGKATAFSIRPTDNHTARSAFVGTIPRSHTFTPLDRRLLLSRVGPEPVELTAVAQVARVPTERETGLNAEQQMSQLMRRFENMGDDTLDREVLDGLITGLGGILEEHGFAAAPRWPAVSVIPLAFYRHVLPSISPDLIAEDIAAADGEETH